MKTFENPLTYDEEQYYLKRYKEGDLEAKDVLIEHNMRLVAHIAKKYNYKERETEELISIGTIGLIKAVGTFDASKGRLATYAAKCIENELLMMLRAERKKSREVSLYESIGEDKAGNVINLMDVLECDEISVYDIVDQKDDIKNLYIYYEKLLNEREKKVIKMRYGLFNTEELTQREVASILGISRSYVSRIEKSAIMKLQRTFKNRL